MRTWFLAIGLVTILAGIVMTSSSGSAKFSSDFPGENKNRAAYVENSWNVSANLVKGDFLFFRFLQGAEWRQGLFDIDEEFSGQAVLYVGVNVTDPRGNTTIYLCKLGKPQTAGEEVVLNFLDKNITRDEGGIDPSWFYRRPTNSYYEVGGTVQFNGTYRFVIGNVYPNRKDPPSSIDIRKVTFTTEHPYTYLLPSGIAVIGVGATITVFSLRKKTKPSLGGKTKH
jgi:hypothetical protein